MPSPMFWYLNTPCNSTEMSFIKTIHKKPYPAISPTRNELSQTGQTVLITGAQGIGYEIAKAFAQAGALRIVIASRNIETINDSAVALKKAVPDYQGELIAKVCDVGDSSSTAKLWEALEAEDIIVDVLVLNVAISGARGPLVDTDLELIWKEFNINVLSHIDFAQRFVKQIRARPNGHKKVIYHGFEEEQN
jgi:NAD(P)-dependent dehydrogenase (short-subunit alcohol dehydrogenase family)